MKFEVYESLIQKLLACDDGLQELPEDGFETVQERTLEVV